MATYNKRGYRPKNKVESETIEESQSTTAEVFSSLDEGASKTEEWVARNQNYILGVIAVIAIGVLGYLAYDQFVRKPQIADANNELYYPQQYFDQAMQQGAAQDSLLNLALNGAEGKFGFLDIIDEYSGTPAANLANYSAGMAYLKMKKYQEAIDHLEDFSSDDKILAPLALGGLGDAFAQLEQPADALSYYEKAFSKNENDYTTPKFLYKAGVLALDMGNKDKAATYFQRIKDDYPNTNEGNNIDALIGLAQNQ